MKKSLLFTGLLALAIAFAACGGKGGSSQQDAQDSAKCTKSEEICKEKAEFEAKWAKFDSLAVEEQEALVAKRAECYTKCLEKAAADTAKCAEKKACCKELTAEQKAECAAKKAELDATWANFANLTLAEKKAFFDKINCCKAKAEKKEGCKKEADAKK
jgi:hypothetical protein